MTNQGGNGWRHTSEVCWNWTGPTPRTVLSSPRFFTRQNWLRLYLNWIWVLNWNLGTKTVLSPAIIYRGCLGWSPYFLPLDTIWTPKTGQWWLLKCSNMITLDEKLLCAEYWRWIMFVIIWNSMQFKDRPCEFELKIPSRGMDYWPRLPRQGLWCENWIALLLILIILICLKTDNSVLCRLLYWCKTLSAECSAISLFTKSEICWKARISGIFKVRGNTFEPDQRNLVPACRGPGGGRKVCARLPSGLSGSWNLLPESRLGQDRD
mgnify:CR=1 FL=1